MGDRSSRETLLLPGGRCAVQETPLSYLALFTGPLTFWSSVSLLARLG